MPRRNLKGGLPDIRDAEPGDMTPIEMSIDEPGGKETSGASDGEKRSPHRGEKKSQLNRHLRFEAQKPWGVRNEARRGEKLRPKLNTTY